MAQAPAAARTFNIPAQPISSALIEFSRQSDVMVLVAPELTAGRRSQSVTGNLPVNEAIARLLRGSGLRAVPNPRGGYRVERGDGGNEGQAPAADTSLAEADPGAESVVVTGTRIRGADTPSPVISITNRQIRDAGFTDLGEVIRSIPQNFAGGQNPNVALGAGGITNQNISSSSGLNLRGLGPDATLTLLNGRRLSYDGFVQAVDVSIVPIGALDRLEIVADGASALYGSDAVAGVANIILRRDFDGVDTTARIGQPTDGGGTQYQASATAGTTWGSGGFILAYEYSHTDQIRSDQRSYTDYMLDPSTIYPSLTQHSALLSAHQKLATNLEFSIDGLYTHRAYARTFAEPTQFVSQPGASEIYTIAPSLELTLANSWTLTLAGTYGHDRVISEATIYTTDLASVLSASRSCYCNTSSSAELDAEGPLISLPGGDVRVALGAGWRRNEFETRSYTRGSVQGGSRSSRYAFGEINIPIVSAAMNVPAISRLVATAALRYEDYRDLGNVSTPKLGLIYEPTPDFSLRGSWGRSFKAPTLLQEYQDDILYLWSVDQVGATGYPAGSTVLMPYGGNRNLKPERAETWSATFSVHPRALPGLRVDVSYFNVNYRDRVVQPIPTIPRTFIDPNYAQFLVLDPSDALKAEALAGSEGGITYNYAGVPYDPANVVAIAYNLYTNAARSRAHGIDVTGSYGFDLGGGHASLTGSATFLRGDQQNSSIQDPFQTVGLLANPPKFAARGGIVWTSGGLTLSGFVNHVGSITDIARPTPLSTGSFTTLDANIRYRSRVERGPLSNLEIGLSIMNLLDQHPPTLPPLYDYTVNYDSTNYSSLGRVISLSLTKHW